ncbi:PLC-like phosphodiesterase [Xylariaceae sp. FL0804]|nr:PLC-like phosphodiesterase [Xylariaceae sp. FL0804]
MVREPGHRWCYCCFPLPSPTPTSRAAAMADLTVRNLTAAPLELKLVERFEAQPAGSAGDDPIGNITTKITGLFNQTSPAVAAKVQSRGEPTHRRDVSFPVGPFELRTTDVRAADPGREVLRLTFACDGHRYRVDVPSPSHRSLVMERLDGAPNEYTVVYVQSGSCLAVLSSANLPCWMRELRDDIPLSALSIPGTHNSPTCHVALPSVRCQAVGVRQQLDNGVRYFDVRVNVAQDNDELVLVHSAFPISLTGNKYFKGLLDAVYAFLDANPSEALIMSIKREGTGKGTDAKLSRILKDKFIGDGRRWYTEPRIPRLGEARGRVVLLRRHANDESLNKEWGGRGWGLDGSAWPDNCADGRVGSGIARVQDFYEIDQTTNIQKKIELARGHLERAAAERGAPKPHNSNNNNNNDGNGNGNHHQANAQAGGHPPHHPPAQQQHPPKPPGPFFINFLSASNFFNANCWPEKIAAKANPAIVEYLCLRHGERGKGPAGLDVGDGGTGVVVTDWCGQDGDWDLIRCVVGWNARLQLKQ